MVFMSCAFCGMLGSSFIQVVRENRCRRNGNCYGSFWMAQRRAAGKSLSEINLNECTICAISERLEEKMCTDKRAQIRDAGVAAVQRTRHCHLDGHFQFTKSITEQLPLGFAESHSLCSLPRRGERFSAFFRSALAEESQIVGGCFARESNWLVWLRKGNILSLACVNWSAAIVACLTVNAHQSHSTHTHTHRVSKEGNNIKHERRKPHINRDCRMQFLRFSNFYAILASIQSQRRPLLWWPNRFCHWSRAVSKPNLSNRKFNDKMCMRCSCNVSVPGQPLSRGCRRT